MGHEARLSTTVEGVQFDVHSERGAFKALVAAEMLMDCFGADTTPRSWLQTYHAHAAELRQAAIQARRERPGANWVVLRLRCTDEVIEPMSTTR